MQWTTECTSYCWTANSIVCASGYASQTTVTASNSNEVTNAALSSSLHHLYLTLPSYIIVTYEASECKSFYHLSWSVQAHRQQPWMAVHPLVSLCLFSQVWRTIFSSAWAAALMCAMFFTCSSSFHFISWAGLLWRSAIWLMCLYVFGCFGVDLRGCFYFFFVCWKSILSAFTSLRFHEAQPFQTYLNEKHSLSVFWYLKNSVFF